MSTQYTWPELKLETPQLTKPSWSSSTLSSGFSTPTYTAGSSLSNQQSRSLASNVGSSAINALGSTITNNLTSNLFGDSEIGAITGNIFSSGTSAATNTMAQNLLSGTSLTKGLGGNMAQSLAGAGVGIAANYLGQGITSAMGDSRLARGVGAGVSTAAGTLGGAALSKAISAATTAGKAAKAASTVGNAAKVASSINPWGLGMSIAGSALGAATGPSKEYTGKYGNVTQTMDTIYDVAQGAVNFVPGVGQIVSGAMALNKGLSNIFGSTSGMTVQDAILGSAFMPAPVKWLNMWGASTTGSFNNQSWQNSEKTKSFMGNSFGNLQDKFDKAKEEAGKTYGTFSQGAKKAAQNNIDYANSAWEKILKMTDQNEYQTIRSSDMSSINNQRYAQDIQGRATLAARGKQGMKILNNATNHIIGMRLLSGAALIDNKQILLSKCRDLD